MVVFDFYSKVTNRILHIKDTEYVQISVSRCKLEAESKGIQGSHPKCTINHRRFSKVFFFPLVLIALVLFASTAILFRYLLSQIFYQ